MELFEISGDRTSPLIVSVPHTGTRIPPEIRRQLAVPVAVVQRRVDSFAWELARTALPQATVIRAMVARAVVDLNRSGGVSELDLTCDPQGESERLVRLYDDQGHLLWQAPPGRPPLSREELEARVRKYHEPYHAALQDLLERAGRPCVLVDLHSMADLGLDLVIGDFRGQSTGAEVCEWKLKPFFAERGYRVGYAGPRHLDRQGRPVPAAAIQHSGGFITSRYGDPARGQYAFQLEVNRRTCARRWEEVKADFAAFFAWVRRELIAGNLFSKGRR